MEEDEYIPTAECPECGSIDTSRYTDNHNVYYCPVCKKDFDVK